MNVKLFEIRDSATFIPAIAVELVPADSQDIYLYRRAGYSLYERYILLARLDGGPMNYDQYDWTNRTMKSAHIHMILHWDELKSGEVIDVQFILGETDKPKISEREEVLL